VELLSIVIVAANGARRLEETRMRLGFYTNYSPAIARFAQETGFRSLELSGWPSSSLNADEVSDDRLDEMRRDLAARDIEISALGYYPNYLHPDREEAAEARRYFLKLLELASKTGVGVVCTFVGRDWNKSVEENLPAFKELFSRFCDEAERRNIRIAIENCPMMGRQTLRSENIAFSPEIWDEMYTLVPSRALGIELDPSHMVFQGIDYIQAIHDYGDRIFHVHAKDAEVDRKKLGRVGIYGQSFGDDIVFGAGWWRFRSPGWGEIDWAKLISALLEVGYDGNLDIEHEDDVFARAATHALVRSEADIVETFGREVNGLILGFNHLSRLIPPVAAGSLLPR
jgi:sugar phosphate isomerase/epimerase